MDSRIQPQQPCARFSADKHTFCHSLYPSLSYLERDLSKSNNLIYEGNVFNTIKLHASSECLWIIFAVSGRIFSPPSHFHFVSAEYVVEFEDQRLTGRGWEELTRVEGNKDRVVLRLWPYISYRFRVIAINEVGKSDPSKPSEIHNTPAEGKSHSFALKTFFTVKV